MTAGVRRLVLAGVFLLLLAAFALALWGTVVHPRAYEVRGVIVARPAPDMILVRHDPLESLGMSAMEFMAVRGDPVLLDAARLAPGDRVTLAVKPRDSELVLIRIARD